MSFLGAYFNLPEGSLENAVCCPFPHECSDGTTYLEHRPSAHVNMTKLTFNCKACDRSFGEVSFINTIVGGDKDSQEKIRKLFSNFSNIYFTLIFTNTETA